MPVQSVERKGHRCNVTTNVLVKCHTPESIPTKVGGHGTRPADTTL